MNITPSSASLDQPPFANPDETQDGHPRVPSVFVASLFAMLPWPLIATLLCSMGSLFEQTSESVLLFGGVTLLFLLPIGMFEPPEWVFSAMFVVVWVLVLALPTFLVARQKLRKRTVVLAYIFQAGFSLSQAGLGLMMIIGRSV